MKENGGDVLSPPFIDAALLTDGRASIFIRDLQGEFSVEKNKKKWKDEEGSFFSLSPRLPPLLGPKVTAAALRTAK